MVAGRIFCEVVDGNALRRLRSLPRSPRNATLPLAAASELRIRHRGSRRHFGGFWGLVEPFPPHRDSTPSVRRRLDLNAAHRWLLVWHGVPLL